MKYIVLSFLLLFSACGIKNYETTQTKVIIIKSPLIKFSDLGYIRNSDEVIEMELFIAGKVIQKITINHLICVSEGCMSKRGFNEEYLNENYPSNILQNIILAKPIYDGLNKEKTLDGFEQKIKDVHVDIKYRVSNGVTFFKDKTNNIIIKIKDTK